MELLSDPQIWLALATLTALEIVLGIDNVVFISILADKLPPEQREKARKIGLFLAMLMRVALLFSLAWVIQLTEPWFTVFGEEISGRDLVLLIGGMFLLAKSTHEIHQSLEGAEGEARVRVRPSFSSVIIQIILLDIVFSLDSVITAVGMVDNKWVMVAAILVAVAVMLFAANPIGNFIDRHPTVKMLALTFIILVGAALVADGFDFHIDRKFLYFAMAFSAGVEALNILANRKHRRPT